MNMLTPNLGEIPALCRKDERPCCSRFLDLLEALCEFFGRYDFALEVAGKYIYGFSPKPILGGTVGPEPIVNNAVITIYKWPKINR